MWSHENLLCWAFSLQMQAPSRLIISRLACPSRNGFSSPTILWQFLASKVLKSTPKPVKQNPKRNAVPSKHSQNRGANMQQIPKHTRLQGINTSCSTQAIFPTKVGNLMAKKSFNTSWLYPFANQWRDGGLQPYVAKWCTNLIQVQVLYLTYSLGWKPPLLGSFPNKSV